MSSFSSMAIVMLPAVAVVVGSIVTLNSNGVLDSFVDAFFELDSSSMVAVLLLVFATIFTAVAIGAPLLVSAVGGPSNKKKSSSSPPSDLKYPLTEIEAATGSEKDQFKTLFPMLRDEILDDMRINNEMPQEALDWCREMLDYNVPGGKLNRGTTVVSVHRALLGGSLTPLQTARASVLGWAIEFLQAFFLVADDVMDDSTTRRGQPCWFRQKKVQLIAINDSFLLESSVFAILKRHFEHEQYYDSLVALFLDVIQKTEFGQLLDLTSQSMESKEIDLSRFTLDRYKLIVKYKTAFYTFYLPVAIGMITSGVTSSDAYKLAKEICCEMGEYFQIQDDYLDCFGAPEVIGKIGTDIQENKCSWLVVQALDRVNEKQRKILEQNYGKWDDRKVAKVKALYKELNLEKVFSDYEEESYKRIQSKLDDVTLMPRDVFELLLKKIYKRSK